MACDGLNFKFFVSVPPPLEEIAYKEFNDKTKNRYSASLLEGGFLFEAPLNEVLYLQKFLKSPTRILMRLSEKRIRDLPKLFQFLQKIPWNDFLINKDYKVHISCSQSRLMNKKKIEESFHKALMTYFKAFEPAKKDFSYQHNIYLRLHLDHLEVSLDISGEPLYKRGGKINHMAPIRENLAYLILYYLKDHFHQDLYFLDPMCGSGTFAYEILNWTKENHRDYAGAYFAKHIKEKEIELNLIPLAFKKIILNDLSKEALDVAKKNLKENKELVEFNQKDIFEFLLSLDVKDSLLISNPPYGKRIKQSTPFEKLSEAIKKSSIDKAYLIHPKIEEKKTLLKLYNGGIKVGLNKVK